MISLRRSLTCSLLLWNDFATHTSCWAWTAGASLLRKNSKKDVRTHLSNRKLGDDEDRVASSPPGESIDKDESVREEPTPPSSVVVPAKPSDDMTAQEIMAALGTNPRRITVSLLSATAIALAGNLFGITSRLLESIPETTVEKTGLDLYFPRGNYKRVRGNGYSFVIPKDWVADTALELAKAQRQARTLDYTLSSQKSSSSVIPDTGK